MDSLRHHFLPCDCGSVDHLIMLWRDDTDGESEVGICVQMSHYLPWWRRAWVALRYVLGVSAGQRCHWADTVIRPEAAEPLRAFLAGEPIEWLARPKSDEATSLPLIIDNKQTFADA
jgi:hypothetical protein